MVVVVTAFAEYRLENAPVFEPTTGPRNVPCADVTFNVTIFARGDTRVVRFDVPETLRDVKVPTDVMFG